MTGDRHRPTCRCATCALDASASDAPSDRAPFWLEEVVRYCDEIAELIVPAGRETFLQTVVLQRSSEALVHRISTTLAERVPRETLAGYPCGWNEFRALRHLFTPAPHDVDPALMWVLLESQIAELRRIIADEILPDLSADTRAED